MIEIIPVAYGKSVLSESLIFDHGAETQCRPILFKIYLVKADSRLILVDAGCETMPGFEMTEFIGSVQALKKLGISPEEITDVVITHAHHDHIACVSRFRRAAVYIQKDEFEVGKAYFTEDMTVHTFEEEVQLCSGVKVVKIGGHSAGSSIVEIAENGQVKILAGDECYVRACLDKRIPTGASYNPEKSRAFVEKYSSPAYTVFLCHDD